MARCGRPQPGNADGLTTPDDRPIDDDTEGSGEAGALAAASDEDTGASDPLGPLDRITEDDAGPH